MRKKKKKKKPQSKNIMSASATEGDHKQQKQTIREQNSQNSLSSGHMCVHITVYTTVVHNTAQNSSDNFLSYAPDNDHSSDELTTGGEKCSNVTTTCELKSTSTLQYRLLLRDDRLLYD